jgi:hypothetical protein
MVRDSDGREEKGRANRRYDPQYNAFQSYSVHNSYPKFPIVRKKIEIRKNDVIHQRVK